MQNSFKSRAFISIMEYALRQTPAINATVGIGNVRTELPKDLSGSRSTRKGESV